MSTQGTSHEEWPIDKLRPNPANPREEVRGEGFDDLVGSVKSQGILQPLLIDSGGVILAGHRRLEAAKQAGLKVVPVRVLKAGYLPEAVSIIENAMRLDLKPMELARQLQVLEEMGMTSQEIATETGMSYGSVRNYLRLAEASPDVQNLLIEGKISTGTALEIMREPAHRQSAIVRNVQEKPDTSSTTAVREQIKTSQGTLDISRYRVQRQRDISLVLEWMTQCEARLAPYAHGGLVPVPIKLLEDHLTKALDILHQCEEQLVDWQISMEKTDRKKAKA